MGIWESFHPKNCVFPFWRKRREKGLRNIWWTFLHPETIQRKTIYELQWLKFHNFSTPKKSIECFHFDKKKGTKCDRKKCFVKLFTEKITFRMVPGGERKWELMDKNLSRNAINVQPSTLFHGEILKFNTSCNAPTETLSIYDFFFSNKKCN